MRLLIVEDEPPAAKRLQQLLLQARPEAEICAVLDSVKGCVRWLGEQAAPDLAFFDIQLADGLSFDIFQQATLPAPVVFTTAYDQYTLKAFKQDSIDYLLKPIDKEELEQALSKFERRSGQAKALDPQLMQAIMQRLSRPSYKPRFIIQVGQQLSYIATEEIQYFYADSGIVYAQMAGQKRHAIDFSLDALVPLLNPAHFFRLNRKVIAQVCAVQKIAPLFNGRLLVKLSPATDFDVTVSRDRAGDFRAWLDGSEIGG